MTSSVSRHRRHRWQRLLLALLAVLTLATSGCPATLPEYVDQRDKWTRSKTHWDGFVANATVHVTLKSVEFREAYVKEYARLFALTARQKVFRAETARCFAPPQFGEAFPRYQYACGLSSDRMVIWRKIVAPPVVALPATPRLTRRERRAILKEEREPA